MEKDEELPDAEPKKEGQNIIDKMKLQGKARIENGVIILSNDMTSEEVAEYTGYAVGIGDLIYGKKK